MSKTRYAVGPTEVTNYSARLVDKYRPPSRGGNTRAQHRHAFQVDEDWHSFLALGTKKWVFVGDTVEFEWSRDDSGKYRNIDAGTIKTKDKGENVVVRG